MTYCSNCGSKIEENDSFCAGCGAKANQSLGNNQSKERSDQTFAQGKPIKSQFDFGEIINSLGTSALNPVSGGEQFVAKAEMNHVILITIILTFVQGLIGIWRANQIASSAQTTVMNFVQNLSTLISSFGGDVSSNDLDSLTTSMSQFKYLMSIPYGRIFMENCALYLISVLVLFIFIYLGISIFTKVKCPPFQVSKIVLISTLPVLISEIISVLFSYYSVYFGIGFVILGAFISITTLVIIVKDSFQIKDNLCIFIVSISYLFALVVFFMVLRSFITSDLLDIIKTTMNLYKSSSFKL